MKVEMVVVVAPQSKPAVRGDIAVMTTDGTVVAEHHDFEWLTNAPRTWVGMFQGPANPGDKASIVVQGHV